MSESKILKELKHDGALYRVRGIVRCIHTGSLSDEELSALKSLTDDPVRVAGRLVGAYARAALNLLTGSKLEPDDAEARELTRLLPPLDLDDEQSPGRPGKAKE